MRSPSLDRQITIEYKAATQDATYGTDVVTWTPLSYLPGSPAVAEKFWAEVTDVTPGRQETNEQGLALSRKLTRFRIRYRSDVDSSMRIVLHGEADATYQIIGGPSEIGRKYLLEILAERISS